MEDQIVSFKTAKTLKKKKFDIIQRYGNEASLYKKNGEHTYYTNYGFMYSGLNEGYISAPTQSFAQKWLREKHNILVVVYPFFNDPSDKDKFWCRVFTPDDKGGTSMYDTYEEALEEGLQIGLNFIER